MYYIRSSIGGTKESVQSTFGHMRLVVHSVVCIVFARVDHQIRPRPMHRFSSFVTRLCKTELTTQSFLHLQNLYTQKTRSDLKLQEQKILSAPAIRITRGEYANNRPQCSRYDSKLNIRIMLANANSGRARTPHNYTRWNVLCVRAHGIHSNVLKHVPQIHCSYRQRQRQQQQQQQKKGTCTIHTSTQQIERSHRYICTQHTNAQVYRHTLQHLAGITGKQTKKI